MTKEEAIKMLQDNIADGDNVFVTAWSFDVHPTWADEFTRDDWNFAVTAMEGRHGEYIDERIADEFQYLMSANRVQWEIQNDLQS